MVSLLSCAAPKVNAMSVRLYTAVSLSIKAPASRALACATMASVARPLNSIDWAALAIVIVILSFVIGWRHCVCRSSAGEMYRERPVGATPCYVYWAGVLAWITRPSALIRPAGLAAAAITTRTEVGDGGAILISRLSGLS